MSLQSNKKVLKVPLLDRDVAIYLAGLSDGEGCFFISKTKKEKIRSNYCYSPSFKIVLTNEETIAWIANKLERPYAHVKAKIGENWQDTYYLRIMDLIGLVKFIPQILPFMITKKETAQSMLDFCESRIKNDGKHKYNHQSYSHSELDLWGSSINVRFL